MVSDGAPNAEPIDPDVDARIPQQRRELPRAPFAVLGVISAGGVLGALARYGLGLAIPHRPGTFPWATLIINVTGCLLIGVLMVLVTEVRPAAHQLLRPFLGTGVLGGFTTFSTYAGDIQQLLAGGAIGTALGYLAGTLVAALAAVYAGLTLTRLAIRPSGRDRGSS